MVKAKQPKAKKSSKKKTSGIPRYPSDLFGDNKMVSMRWSHHSSVNSGTSGVAYRSGPTEHIFSLSALQRPRVQPSTVSGQLVPHLLDQYLAVFANYKVVGAYVKITFFNPRDESMTGIIKVDTSGEGLTVNTEDEDISNLSMRKNIFLRQVADSGSQKTSFKHYYDFAKLEGLKKSAFLGDEGYQGSMTLSQSTGLPEKELSIILNTALNTSTAAATPLSYKIEIDYKVKLFGRKTVAPEVTTA